MSTAMVQSMEPVEQGGIVYVPISLKAVRIDSIPAFDLYLQPGPAQPFVLYCEKNTPILESTLRRLTESRVPAVYIRHEHRRDYQRYIAENFHEILLDPDLSIRQKAAILYDSAQAVVEEVLLQPASREAVERGKNIASTTVDFMTRDDFPLEHLLRTISCDDYLYTHSVNVVAYSVALAQRAGIADRASLRELANGALLHDVGKSTLEPELLAKSAALSALEWERVRQTPREGHEMLQKAGCLGEIALDIVLHHHERLDGSGYPDCLEGNEISPFVRIVSIADVFDAITSERYHQKARPAFEALSLMKKNMTGQIDADLFRLFIEIMGVRG